MTLEAIRYHNGTLEILDQLLLPAETKYIPILGVEDGWKAINRMQVTYSLFLATLFVNEMCYIATCGRRASLCHSQPLWCVAVAAQQTDHLFWVATRLKYITSIYSPKTIPCRNARRILKACHVRGAFCSITDTKSGVFLLCTFVNR